MSANILVDIDGTVRDASEPFLHADDLAAVRGDGIFETLLVRDGRACNVTRHLDRLARSATMLEMAVPHPDAWRTAIDVAVKEWAAVGDAQGWLRLVCSRGRESEPGGSSTSFVTVGPVGDRVLAARRDGVSVVTLDRGFSSDFAAGAPWQLLGAKTLSYATNMAALRYATAHGYDDVIYLSADGLVLEGPRSTVIARYGDRLVTPPTDVGILPGTTQLATFALAEREGWETEVASLTPARLRAADGVWLISSVTLAARVTALDGNLMPDVTKTGDFADLVHRAVWVD